MKKLVPLVLVLLLSSCARQEPPASAPSSVRAAPVAASHLRPVDTGAAPIPAPATAASAPAKPSTPAAAAEVKLDIAVASKAKPAPAGWTEWILPADAATATKDFPFAGGKGPGGADTIRVTISTGAANNWNDRYGIAAAAGYPFEGVIADHAVAEGTGAEGSCVMKFVVEGLPAGSTVKGALFSSVNKEGYAAYYGENGSYDASISVSANGAGVAAEQSYITEPVDAKNAGIAFSFTATGKDALDIANTKSNWLIMPVDGISLAIGG